MRFRTTPTLIIAAALPVLMHTLACSSIPDGAVVIASSPPDTGSPAIEAGAIEDGGAQRCARGGIDSGAAIDGGGVPLLATTPPNSSVPALTIAFVGDSITAGANRYPVHGVLPDDNVRYSDYAQAFFEAASLRRATFKSFGLGGTTTASWVPQSPGTCEDGGVTSPDAGFAAKVVCTDYAEILAWKPDYVHVMLGVNDAKSKANTAGDYVSNIHAFCNYWIEHGISCLVSFETSLNPDATACPASVDMNARLRQYQKAVLALDDGKHIRVISSLGDPSFDNYARTLAASSGDYVDCFHPTAIGREAIGRTIASSLLCAGL